MIRPPFPDLDPPPHHDRTLVTYGNMSDKAVCFVSLPITNEDVYKAFVQQLNFWDMSMLIRTAPNPGEKEDGYVDADVTSEHSKTPDYDSTR